MNLNLWFHVMAEGKHFREIVAEVAGYVSGSKLYEHAASLNACIVGEGSIAGLFWPKWNVERVGATGSYEYPTLVKLWEHAKQEPESAYLYLHTKNASKGLRVGNHWRRNMLSQVVGRWREALDLLNGVDAVGCFKMEDPAPHFSGNYWLARGDYLATLKRPEPDSSQLHERLNAELWVLSNPEARAHELMTGDQSQLYLID